MPKKNVKKKVDKKAVKKVEKTKKPATKVAKRVTSKSALSKSAKKVVAKKPAKPVKKVVAVKKAAVVAPKVSKAPVAAKSVKKIITKAPTPEKVLVKKSADKSPEKEKPTEKVKSAVRARPEKQAKKEKAPDKAPDTAPDTEKTIETAPVKEPLEAVDVSEEEENDEVVLTDAEGRRYCRVKECDQLSSVDGYCRYHYLLFWKKIQVRKKILTEGKLERYIEELTARYPDKFLDVLRKDLRSDKEFLAAIQELEIDESATENEFEDEAQTYIDEVRGMGEPAARDDEDF